MSSRRATVAIGAAAIAAVGTTGCGARITDARLERAFAPTIARLYVAQQALEGYTAPVPYVTASCARAGRTGGSSGAGSDWTCIAQLAVTGRLQAASYEVDVRTNGCYTAQGAPAVVGPPVIITPGGARRVNPLAELDGCFPL